MSWRRVRGELLVVLCLVVAPSYLVRAVDRELLDVSALLVVWIGASATARLPPAPRRRGA